MKKILSCVLVILTLALVPMSLSSCGTVGDAHMGFKIITDENIHDYVLEVPSDWDVTSNNGFVSATAKGVGGDMSNISVMTSQLPVNPETGEIISTPEANFDNLISSYTELYRDVEVESRDVDVKLGDENAKKYVFSCKIADRSYKYMQVLCAHGGRIYIITYTSTPDFYAEHEEEVKEIINLFRFRA